jgi:NlpC/P60 family putative phage cell wall peptidase
MSFKEAMRQSVVTTARSWIGTPWRHRGRARHNVQFGGGVDCAGLIIEVGNGLGLFNERIAFQFYSRLPSGSFVRQACEAYLVPKPLKDKLPGDILLLNIHNEARHLAIYSDSNTIIHAYALNKEVTEQHLDEVWQQRLVAAFAYPKLGTAA